MSSLLHSVVNFKCPRCRKGRMFEKGTLYQLKKFGTMNKNCPYCNQSFEPEPGYYFGAMFISYGFNAAYFAIIWVLSYLLLGDVDVVEIIIMLIVVVLGLLPITFRLSRILWINIFVRFDGQKKAP